MAQQPEKRAPDAFEMMQRAFSTWPQVGDTARQPLQTFWKCQDKLLDSMQEYSRGWFERRREATKTAIDAAKSMCDTENPVEAMQHIQNWMMKSAERLGADAVAWQKHVMNSVESLAGPVAAEAERRASAITSVSPARSEKTSAAA